VGGGSNAAGIFAPFVDETAVELIGAEAGGRGQKAGDHAASLSKGRPGILHGSFSYVLQDDDGQTLAVHSISAGLDYPGVGPEHSFWKDLGRARYESITDAEALEAYNSIAKREGILPALESSHALAQAFKEARRLGPGKVLVVCLSGRGDKDAYEVARLRGEPI
jgi:tryptophan synthase beta chain